MRKVIASCSVILIAGLALAACGGSSGSSKAGATNPPSGASASGATASGATGGSSSGNDNFAKLVSDANKQKFKITFTAGSGGNETTYEQDGNGNSVYSSGGSQTFTTSSGTVSCNTNSDGKAECIKTGVTGVSPFLGFYNLGKTYIDALGNNYGHTSSKTIAGRSAKCVTFSASDFAGAAGAALAGQLKGSATYCVDKDTGVLLEISGTNEAGASSTTFVATKYEQPSDSDFTPPATPQTIPSISLPAGITIPGGG